MDFFALVFIFRMRYDKIGGREIPTSFLQIARCSGIMVVACWLGLHYPYFTIPSRFLGQLVTLPARILGARGLDAGPPGACLLP